MTTTKTRRTKKAAPAPSAPKTVGLIPTKHTVHTLVGTIKWLREDPDNRLVKPKDYFADSMNLDQFMAWFRRQLDLKITNEMPPRVGRKLDDDWQRNAYQTAQRVNTPRLIVRVSEVAPEFRTRLAHRLTKPEDF